MYTESSGDTPTKPDAFISYVEEDHDVASQIASCLEKKGYATWYYERDCLPGLPYLVQVGEAIEACRAILLIVSPESLGSNQVTNEVVRAYEARKCFVPILRNITHVELQNRQPLWRQCLGAATSIAIPREGVDAIVPRIEAGLRALGIQPPKPGPQVSTVRSAPRKGEAVGRRVNSLGNTMIRVPEEYLVSWQPPVAALFVSATCVSNLDYLEFVRAGHPEPGCDPERPKERTWTDKKCPETMLRHPVIYITPSHARSFCEWLTNKERAEGIIGSSERYTLPIFEQWKRVAQTGGLPQDFLTDRQWEEGRHQPTEPADWGSPNPMGLYCLFGNVFEWCLEERSKEYPYQGRTTTKRWSLAVGGGWASSRDWLMESVRKGHYGAIWCPVGPRCVKDAGFRLWLVSRG